MGNHCQLLYDYIDSHVGKNTMFIGFSTTFMQNVDVLKPLIDIAPDFIHPTLNISHIEIMAKHSIKKQIISQIDFDL